ncbi:MAG: DUF378 domain-containing protein [Gammaproteobacteria bacterium]
MKKLIDWVAYLLVIIGALNWGLVGAANMNLVQMLFGDMGMVANIIYILVGLAGIWVIFSKCTGCCKKS